MSTTSLFSFIKALIVLCLFAFTQGFSHIPSLRPSSSHHSGMSHSQPSGKTDSVSCQILCTTAVAAPNSPVLSEPENDETDPSAFGKPTTAALALLLAFGLVVKLLYKLNSWRPPDKIVAYGHCSDGL